MRSHESWTGVDHGNGDVICCVHTAERVMRGIGTDVAHSTSSFCCGDQHVQGSNLAQAAELRCLQLTPRMLLHGCEAATVTPSSDKKDADSSWNSTGWQRLRQMSRRHERQLAKG